MKHFTEKIGENGAEAVFYLHEPSDEMAPDKKYPAMVIIPGGAYMWVSDRIGIIGFSAGGNLAGQLSVFWKKEWLEKETGYSAEMMKPNIAVLAYPMLNCVKASERSAINTWVNRAMLGNEVTEERLKTVSPVYQVNKDVPQTFIWHTTEDTFVPVENSLKYVTELQKYHVPYELHIYQKGEHGFVLGDERTDSMPDHSQVNEQGATWLNLSLGWMKQIGFMK